MGALKVIGQQSIMAFASQFQKEARQYQMNFMIGVNLSGVISFLLRVIVLLLLKNSLTRSQILYSIISVVFSVTIIIVTNRFLQSEKSKKALDPARIQFVH